MTTVLTYSFWWRDFGKCMPDATDRFEVDCETASNLRRLVLEEISDDVALDETTVDALVRGIVSLLQSP
jgi:hypothetical protein